MLFDHVDLRVGDLKNVRPFYDALLQAMGFTRFDEDAGMINYHLPDEDRSKPFFGLMEDASHAPNGTRVAFRSESRADVDRIAQIAHAAGARAFEPPEGYGGAGWYYAAFFEDPEGNKLEICYRENT